jgi:uncharacterized membrane protein YeaQ/YmgE (transglycosylase-associated protein family)
MLYAASLVLVMWTIVDVARRPSYVLPIKRKAVWIIASVVGWLFFGIVGAFVATFIGQAVGWYRLDQGAGLIGATVGAVIVLFIWNRLVAHHVIGDRGAGLGPQGRGP